MAKLRIATRGSDLALWQARFVAERVKSVLGADSELVVIKTTGDRLTGSLANQGGKGLFIKEIEEALVDGSADLAVHSAKDLPAAVPDGLALVAFPERADPRDALVCRAGAGGLADLPAGARVATGSARRTALLRLARPDLEIAPMRGNVPTRLDKLRDPGENLDALVLACAGLDRLGFGQHVSERISADVLLPAVCQGVLAIEARDGSGIGRDLHALSDPDVEVAVAAERAFLSRLEGDCSVPLGAHAEVSGDRVRLRGLVANLDGSSVVRDEASGSRADARALGESLAEAVLGAGGSEILAALHATGG